jgi:putative ABC transport system ATP-binding protein
MIEINNITKSYGSKDNVLPVLKGITLKMKGGDFSVILGPSGSGKSTLLNTISGLERPDSGTILYNSEDITTLSDAELTLFRKNNIGFIFQQYYLLPNLNVRKNVKMGADLAGNRDYKQIIEADNIVGISSRYYFSETMLIYHLIRMLYPKNHIESFRCPDVQDLRLHLATLIYQILTDLKLR